MLRNILCCIILVLFLAHIHGQSVYMHEAQEEAMEQEKEGGTFTGIVGTILLFGIIYFLATIHDTRKEHKERREEYMRKKSYTDSIADSSINKNVNISKYQRKEAWQKGYKRAEYDRIFGTPRKLDDKTIEDLIAEYRHLCALGHIVQADKIMEEIGYFQSFEPQTGN